ncbi:ABC transporter permease [Oceanobacillus alkalisoli]|uniref:ABC transporter permease n=1 Tax=Oceanobacillus alkalisoli TaxID=2925113 RepID=UPI001EE41934|nr:ABC transporter permease [Oceanobacillus alkalisoli]MCG5102837.1 ABC transporter permease [Oceanobacillus alkalisoli]
MLFKIYKKEMIDSFRDKRTLLLTVLLPILMMSALTFFYESLISDGENETYTLAVEEGLSTGQETILGTMDNVELLRTENPEQAFIDGDVQAAIVFADNFDAEVQAGEAGNVELIGDTFSQKSSNLIFIVTSKLAEYEQIVVAERLQHANIDPSITQAVAMEQRETNAEDSNIQVLALLIPLILSIAIGVGAGPSAADIFAGEKEKKTMEALLMTPVNRSTLLMAKYLTISSVGVIIGIITLAVVAIEVAFFTEHLKAAISFGDNMVAIIGMGALVTLVYSFFVGALLMITSIVGKTVKEAQSYSTPIMMVIIFPAMMIGGLGVNEFTMNHFILPFVNIFAILTELLFGVVNYGHIFMTIGSNLVCIIIIFIISRILFSKDKWVMN